ncbi:MAG TPA: hypothetical protein PKA55_16250 [Rhodoblastus sp.]|nr:hypothetical protein [Rhodoblastus sp.]
MRLRDLARGVALLPLLASPVLGEDAAAIEEGRALLKEHNCNGNCHQSHADDNEALSLYTREDRKARDRAALDRYVRACVASVGAMAFPDDIAKMSSALNADFYKYK